MQVATKAPGHEPVAVGVDEVAGHVLAESRRGRARQAEVHGAGAPERDLRPAHHRPDLEPVAGQESFRGQDAEGVDVVVALRLPAGPPVRSLEPLHEPVAAAKQRLVIRFERAATLALGVEAGNLPHRPLQAAPQARDDVFQVVGERVDVGAQRGRGRNAGILGRPALPEHSLYADGQVCGMALNQIAQRAEVERRAADFAVLEQVRLHPPRQAAVQHVPDGGAFPLRPGGVPPVAVQRADDRRVHVLGDHHVVAQIEGGRIDAAVEQLQRLGEVGPVVRDGPAVGQVHRHAMAPTGATGALPVVGGQRRHVAHQHRVEPADVDAELQGRRAHQTVHRLRVALEQVLQALPLVRRHHRRVLFGAQHRVGAVEQLQVVAVLVFRDPFDDAVAAPGDAAAVRGLAGGGAAAAPAPPHAAVGREPETVGVHLVYAADVRQWASPGPLEPDRDQQPAFHQECKEALEERPGGVRGHLPLPRDLPHRGLAGLARPLDHQRRRFGGLAAQLRPRRPAKIRQIALLNLRVAVLPVLREELVLGVVERAPAAQIVEHARHALPQVLRRDAEIVGALLHPGQGGIQAGVLHLHPAPGLEAQRLPRRQGNLAQYLEPKVLAAFLRVAPAGMLAAGNLPDFRNQRPRQRLVALQPIVEMRDEIADGLRAVPDALRHEGAQPEAARVVLHPAGLERGILPVVAEAQKPRPLGAVHHVLGQHVNVRDVDGPDRASGFPVPAAVRRAAGGPARQATRQESGALLLLSDGKKPNRVPTAAAGEAAGHRRRVRGAATAAEVKRRGTGMRGRRLLFLVCPDQGVDKDDPPAAELLFLVLPAGSARARIAAPRGPPREGEVPEERDVVVLPADGARGDGKLCESFAVVGGRAVVLGRKPEPRTVALRREGHDRPTDAAHEPMHDRPQQRPTVAARRGAERQPGEDLGFGDRPPDSALQGRRQILQSPRGRQLLVQPEDQRVAGQRRVQHLRPLARAQFFSRQCAVDVPDVRTGRGTLFHGLHRAVENRGGVFPGSRRGESPLGPDLGLVVLPDRRHRVARHAEETRREVAPGLRIVVIDDGRRGRDARRASRVGPDGPVLALR